MTNKYYVYGGVCNICGGETCRKKFVRCRLCADKNRKHGYVSIGRSLSKTNDKNPSWRGEKVGYVAGHARLRKKKIRPASCEFCKKTKKLELVNIRSDHKFTLDTDDYVYGCRSCHNKLDGRINNIYQK